MKKTVVALFAMVSFAGAAFAADVVDLNAGGKMGKVAFPHKVHQTLLKDCKKCHEKAPGKIAGFGKDWAHKTCKGCHVDSKKGPTGCKDCHKK